MELGRLVSGGLAALSAALVTGIVTPPAPAPTLTASASAVQPGSSFTITGSGFGRCVDRDSHPVVDLFANNNQLALATENTAVFQQQIAIPASTAAGPFLVTAQCSSDAGQMIASVSVTVGTVGSLALSRSSGPPGTTITATGSGYQCHEVQVQLVRDDTQTVAASGPVDSPGGTLDTELTVPASAITGDDYQVEASCYLVASSAFKVVPMASEPFTVTPLAASPSPTPVSPSPTMSSPSPSPSPSTAPSSPSRVSSSASSSASVSPPPLHPAGGQSTPVALIGGTSAGAVLIALVAVRSSSLVHGRRGRGWVNKHMRAVAGQTGSVSADVQRRPGAASVSVGLEPHPDPLGHQQEADQ